MNAPFYPITPAAEQVVQMHDGERSPVVVANWQTLEGGAFDEMLSNESTAGHNGLVTVDGLPVPCVGINGFADTTTGHITALGNTNRHIDPVILERDAHIRLRVGVLPSLSIRILGVETKAELSDRAKVAILAAAALYNNNHQ